MSGPPLRLRLAMWMLSTALVGCAGSRQTSGGASAPSTATPVAGCGCLREARTPALTDEEILHVLETASSREIERARLAREKGQDPGVQALAEAILRAQTASEARRRALAETARLQPAANAVSEAIDARARQQLAAMDAEAGGGFDKTYVYAQAREHAVVLDTIDRTLLPSAKNASLRVFLNEVRGALAERALRARSARTGLGGT